LYVERNNLRKRFYTSFLSPLLSPAHERLGRLKEIKTEFENLKILKEAKKANHFLFLFWGGNFFLHWAAGEVSMFLALKL